MARPIKKNADYFSHDNGMRNDLRIKAVRRKFGNEGFAIWNYLLEVLTDSEDFKYEYNEINKELLSADFDTTISTKKCLENVIKHVKNGSIITFHDSIKARENLKYVVPKILEYYTAKGFSFKSIH